MSDPADDRAAYREALARAEARAVEESEADGTPALSTGELPGAVPVQASDQPLVPAVPAVPATVETPAVVAQIAQTPEELQAEIARLQAQLGDKDSFIGRQSTEVGDLRRAVEELQVEVSRQKEQPPVAVSAPVQITQEMIDDDPANATLIAFKQQDEHALQRAFEAWKEEDSTSATVWLVTTQAEQREAQLRAELKATNDKLEEIEKPQVANAAATAEQDAWNDAFTTVGGKHADFIENAERILTDVAPKFPAITSQLAGGTAEEKAEILTALYEIDRAQRMDPAALAAQLEQEATAAADEAAASRAGAAVVSGQPTVGQPVVEKTDEELEQERYLARQQGGVSLDRGWTGRA